MSDEVESMLINHLHEQANAVISPEHPPATLRAAIRRSRARRRGYAIGAASVAIAPVVAISLLQPWSSPQSEPAAGGASSSQEAVVPTSIEQTSPSAPTQPTASTAVSTTTAPMLNAPIWDGEPSKPLGDSRPVSCAEDYSLDALAARGFAFDGTVVDISPSAPPGTLPDGEIDHFELVATTFEVHEWFRGGDPASTTVTIAMPPSTDATEMHDFAVDGTTWGIASRLLITGESRFGTDPLDDPIAWMCGFSRTYDPATATQWRDAFDESSAG